MHPRFLTALACLGLLAACGGGTGAPSAQVTGKVATVNGLSSAVGGVQVDVVGGGSAVTAPDGTFTVAVPADQPFRLRFSAPSDVAGAPHADVSESGDDTPDETDLDGSDVAMDGLGSDEPCRVDVEMEDGEVIEVWVDHGEGHLAAESRLLPPDGSGDATARGEAEVRCGDGCCRLEVEAQGLAGPAVYDVVLQQPDGDQEATLGTLETNADGAGHFVAEACEGDPLPFDAASLADLAGAPIVLVGADGTILLQGTLPGDGAQHDDREYPGATWALTPPDGSPEPDARGGAGLRCCEGCCRFVVEVGQIAGLASLEVVLVGADGAETSLGTMEIDEHGMGRLVVEDCSGDTLPFDMQDPASVLSTLLELRAQDGTVVLRGEASEVHEGHHEGDGGDGHHDGAHEGGLAELDPPDGAPYGDARGVVLVGWEDAGFGTLVLEAGGLPTGAALDVRLVPAEGDAVVLGSLEPGPEGGARFALELHAGSLPLGVETPAAWAGLRIEVVDGDGVVLLAGEMPALHAGD
jgi:hypothetical protein